MNKYLHAFIFGVGSALALRLTGVTPANWQWWAAAIIIAGLHVFLPRPDDE